MSNENKEIPWSEMPFNATHWVALVDLWARILCDRVQTWDGSSWVGLGNHIDEYTDEWKDSLVEVNNRYSNPRLKNKKDDQSNKYDREIKPNVFVDVYDVLHAFKVVNPAAQHAIKKLLCSGSRGHKTKEQDLKEALDSIKRAIDLEVGDNDK